MSMSRPSASSGQSVTDALCKFALSQVNPAETRLSNGDSNSIPSKNNVSSISACEVTEKSDSSRDLVTVENGSSMCHGSDSVVFVTNKCDNEFDDNRFTVSSRSVDPNSIPFINDGVIASNTTNRPTLTDSQIRQNGVGGFEEQCERTYQSSVLFEKSASVAATARDGSSARSDWLMPNPFASKCLTSVTGLDLQSQLWQTVQKNPFSFDDWTKLIQHVESAGVVDHIRGVYNAFLPLYPYCYAYWKKYADMEYTRGNVHRAFQVLEHGVASIPLSVDLWTTYLNLYGECVCAAGGDPDGVARLRQIGRRSLLAAGRQYDADCLWELVVRLEMRLGSAQSVLTVYRQLMTVPTRAHDAHWCAVLQLIHDYHPKLLLTDAEYVARRKQCCIELNVPFQQQEDSQRKHNSSSSSSAAQDGESTTSGRVISAIRDKIIEEVTRSHELTKAKLAKVAKFEDKIKRPYFHVIPLEKRQIRAWKSYLELEMTESSDVSCVVLLFERCLVACAQYEDMWIDYTRYLERKLDKGEKETAKPSFGVTQVSTTDSVCTGGVFQDTAAGSKTSKVDDAAIGETLVDNHAPVTGGDAVKITTETTVPTESGDCARESSQCREPDGKECSVGSVCDTPASEDDKHELASAHGDSSRDHGRWFEPRADDDLPWRVPVAGCTMDSVRSVYRRACLVHCANKPNIRLQWAQFEELAGRADTARQLINTVIATYGEAVRPRLMLIALERRQHCLDECNRQYELATEAAAAAGGGAGDQQLRSWWAMKHARFCFKIRQKSDQALSVLRTALKKDRCNVRLYDYILDICYQRNPVDTRGVAAVLTLALNNASLTPQQRLGFLRKRVELYEEFESLKQLRAAEDALAEAVKQLKAADKSAKKQQSDKVADTAAGDAGAAAAVKSTKRKRKPSASGATALDGAGDSASAANSAATDSCPRCHWRLTDPFSAVPVPPLPVPPALHAATPLMFPNDAATGLSAVEHTADSAKRSRTDTEQAGVEATTTGGGGVPPVAAMIPPAAACFNSFPQFQPAFPPFVAPPVLPQPPIAVLNQMPPVPIPPVMPPVPIPPVMPPVPIPPVMPPVRLPDDEPVDVPVDVGNALCVNVPDWFVSEGGDWGISEGEEGWSVLRHWPNFLSTLGCTRMFDTLRQHVHWQQKHQPTPGGGAALPLRRLVAWFGAADYTRDGCTLQANTQWPPQLIDLLHRLSDLNDLELNSCALSLFVDGASCHPWHWEQHAALGPAPTLVLVSLGARRLIEFRRRGDGHFLRFPLLPGSLLIMEGRVQSDWLHRSPAETSAAVSGERISLEFRTMYDF